MVGSIPFSLIHSPFGVNHFKTVNFISVWSFKSFTVWTVPLPNVFVPINGTFADSCSAAAKISDALALLPSMITATGSFTLKPPSNSLEATSFIVRPFLSSNWTIVSPFFKNILAIRSAWSSSPPGFWRTSITKDLAPLSRKFVIVSFNSWYVFLPKDVILIEPICASFLSNSPVTVLTGIFPRLIEIFLVSPSLWIVNSTEVPFLPRTFETTSASFIPFVAVPSTFSIISPSLIPAFSAGESATGASATTGSPSFIVIVAPIPSKSPDKLSFKSLAADSFR